MHSRVHTVVFILATGTFACSDDTSSECVEIDNQLADPPSRVWCDADGEHAKLIDPENYCCYQVAPWGSGCKDEP